MVEWSAADVRSITIVSGPDQTSASCLFTLSEICRDGKDIVGNVGAHVATLGYHCYGSGV
jgi:hypothetical protein